MANKSNEKRRPYVCKIPNMNSAFFDYTIFSCALLFSFLFAHLNYNLVVVNYNHNYNYDVSQLVLLAQRFFVRLFVFLLTSKFTN